MIAKVALCATGFFIFIYEVPAYFLGRVGGQNSLVVKKVLLVWMLPITFRNFDGSALSDNNIAVIHVLATVIRVASRKSAKTYHIVCPPTSARILFLHLQTYAPKKKKIARKIQKKREKEHAPLFFLASHLKTY